MHIHYYDKRVEFDLEHPDRWGCGSVHGLRVGELAAPGRRQRQDHSLQGINSSWSYFYKINIDGPLPQFTNQSIKKTVQHLNMFLKKIKKSWSIYLLSYGSYTEIIKSKYENLVLNLLRCLDIRKPDDTSNTYNLFWTPRWIGLEGVHEDHAARPTVHPDVGGNQTPCQSPLQSVSLVWCTVQGNQLNMTVFFWFLIKSDLSSIRFCTRVQ